MFWIIGLALLVAAPIGAWTARAKSEARVRSDETASALIRPAIPAPYVQTRTINPGAVIGSSIGWGVLFGTIAAFVVASSMSFFWSNRSHNANELAILMVVWVPLITIMGGIAAAALFGVVGAALAFQPFGFRPTASSFAALGCLLALGLMTVALPSWAPFQWPQFTLEILPNALLPVFVAGFLVGWRVEVGIVNDQQQADRTDEECDDRVVR